MSALTTSNAGVGLAPGNDVIGLILQISWLGFFLLYMFYGQRLQIKIMLKEIEGSLYKLQLMRDRGRTMTIATIKEVGKTDGDLEARVDRLLEHMDIAPVELDPSGIIKRLEHIIDIRDFRFKDEVKLMVPYADETQVNNLTNMIDAALMINQIYKIVKHLYLSGKKTSSFYVIMQLQMILPDIMKESEAYTGALTAFKAGQPIGDGIGALVAAKLMNGTESHEIARDNMISELQIEERTAYIIKAKGPGGNVGKPGEAIKQILEEKEGKVARIIIIDAAQKLEGEKPGEVIEGTGVAIGGAVDKFKVEEVATKYKIPLNVVLIKEGVGDVISAMRKEICDSVDEVSVRIQRILRETTKKGDTVIIAGIGNTMGIAQ